MQQQRQLSLEDKVTSLGIASVGLPGTVYAHSCNVVMSNDVDIMGDPLAMVDDDGVIPSRLQIGDRGLPRHRPANDRTQNEEQQQPGFGRVGFLGVIVGIGGLGHGLVGFPGFPHLPEPSPGREDVGGFGGFGGLGGFLGIGYFGCHLSPFCGWVGLPSGKQDSSGREEVVSGEWAASYKSPGNL
ncbi:MAG: hypothetical protein WA655_15065 [Candidatus Korobacteraceae bacterium]